VKIGGIDQWITITGNDRRNPVVLFLHDGPGDAWSLVAESLFAGWEKDLTLVQWDQRGAGRTYARSGPSVAPTMTIERMTDDGIEVAEHLIRHLADFRIPILFIHGEVDLVNPPELARAYLDSIRAPRKEFHLVPEAAMTIPSSR
jgi:pimeloyl-ACP methyl ester carboxylesterase